MVNGKPVQTNDNFAVYDDPNEAFQHFTGLISSGRYAPAWQQFQQSGDWQTLLRGINDAGYATDPQWWQKIGSLSNTVLKYANDTGAATAPALTTVTSAGGAGNLLTYPRLYVKGPGALRTLADTKPRMLSCTQLVVYRSKSRMATIANPICAIGPYWLAAT
jgi:hypothetical protein